MRGSSNRLKADAWAILVSERSAEGGPTGSTGLEGERRYVGVLSLTNDSQLTTEASLECGK